MLPARNNVYTSLASTAAAADTSIALVNAAGFPASGIVVLAGNLDPMTNEVVYYAGKSGNALTGCVRGFDGTTAETHVTGSMAALALIAKHITDLQPQLGDTAMMNLVAATLNGTDIGRRFYNTDQSCMFEWLGADFFPSVQVAHGPVIREYIGPSSEVLPLDYRRCDRWTDNSHARCLLRICIATAVTHTLADWALVGRQG
jgi:hypothetical protein